MPKYDQIAALLKLRFTGIEKIKFIEYLVRRGEIRSDAYNSAPDWQGAERDAADALAALRSRRFGVEAGLAKNEHLVRAVFIRGRVPFIRARTECLSQARKDRQAAIDAFRNLRTLKNEVPTLSQPQRTASRLYASLANLEQAACLGSRAEKRKRLVEAAGLAEQAARLDPDHAEYADLAAANAFESLAHQAGVEPVENYRRAINRLNGCIKSGFLLTPPRLAKARCAVECIAELNDQQIITACGMAKPKLTDLVGHELTRLARSGGDDIPFQAHRLLAQLELSLGNSAAADAELKLAGQAAQAANDPRAADYWQQWAAAPLARLGMKPRGAGLVERAPLTAAQRQLVGEVERAAGSSRIKRPTG